MRFARVGINPAKELRMASIISMADRQARSLRSLKNDRNLARFVVEATVTGRQLGTGSYGSVEEVIVEGLKCAGKKFHEILLDAANVGVREVAQKYLQECQLMSNLRHPNITQFMGVCFLPDCQLPVLVMEKLDGSLDDLLEIVPNIPLTLKRSVLEDVARGLQYLHQRNPKIIHRDLTAKNVLLTSYCVAKITDLGSETAHYGPSLDIFSYGHLALFTLNEVYPSDLLEHTYPDPDNPDRLVGRSEVERRKIYFEQLMPKLPDVIKHPLVTMVKECLGNVASRRPTAEQLVTTLEGIKADIEGPYGEFVKVDAIRHVMTTRALKQRDTEEHREAEICQKDIQLNEFRQVLTAKDATLNEVRQQVNQLQFTLTLKRCADLPHPGDCARSTIMNGKVYCSLNIARGSSAPFTIVTRVYCYDLQQDQWSTLPPLPAVEVGFGFGQFNGRLVALGGIKPDDTVTNEVFTFDEKSQTWKPTISPMPTARFYCDVVSVLQSLALIVAGGTPPIEDFTDVVEVYKNDTQQWYRTDPLPIPNRTLSSVVAEDNIFIFEGFTSQGSGNQHLNGVLQASITDLLDNAVPVNTNYQSQRAQSAWKRLPNTPVFRPGGAVLAGSLIAIGGFEASDSMVARKEIYKYSSSTKSWIHIGDLPAPRAWIRAAILSPIEVLIIGGYHDNPDNPDNPDVRTVYKGIIQFPLNV